MIAGYDGGMSEQSPEPTTATDLEAGGSKPGNDYGDTGGIGTDDEAGGETPSGEGDPGARGADDGDAVPDDPSAAAAQGGVQEAFGVAPQLDD
jgi:hypothetical protein